MNYYEHHLGDYAKDAGHLSLIEEGAYRRLLDAYYTRERPLPADLRECCKLARATSKPEREAVAYVLAEFFTLDPDGGHRQARADVEIARFQDKQRKAKASADARWAQSGRNANADANASPAGMRTHSEGNAPRARPQSPVTRLPTEAKLPSVTSLKARATKRCPPEFVVTAELVAWARNHAPGVDVERETIKLRNHPFRTARSDWPATWQNWILEAADRLPRNAGKNLAQSFRERDANAAAAEVREWTGGRGVTAKPHADPHQQQDTLDMEQPHAALGHD